MSVSLLLPEGGQEVGDAALAAAQIVTTLEGVFVVGSIGLMSATTTLVGRSVGRGDVADATAWVRRLTRAGIGTAAVFGVLFAASVLLLDILFGEAGRDVRVLIVGQDPYPTPGHAVGLSFSVAPDVRPVPKSLVNIYRELETDLGLPTPSTGDLTPWADQGVLLLNRVLTVSPGKPASHRGRGWEHVTARAIEALVERGGPLVAVLWGGDARKLAPLLGDVPVVESAHP